MLLQGSPSADQVSIRSLRYALVWTATLDQVRGIGAYSLHWFKCDTGRRLYLLHHPYDLRKRLKCHLSGLCQLAVEIVNPLNEVSKWISTLSERACSICYRPLV